MTRARRRPVTNREQQVPQRAAVRRGCAPAFCPSPPLARHGRCCRATRCERCTLLAWMSRTPQVWRGAHSNCWRCGESIRYRLLHLAPLTSHLTPHTSHLTPHPTLHTSHLTPHTSHLTPHTSHTPHLSTSHLTPYTSHLTPHTSHIGAGAILVDQGLVVASTWVQSVLPPPRPLPGGPRRPGGFRQPPGPPLPLCTSTGEWRRNLSQNTVRI